MALIPLMAFCAACSVIHGLNKTDMTALQSDPNGDLSSYIVLTAGQEKKNPFLADDATEEPEDKEPPATLQQESHDSSSPFENNFSSGSKDGLANGRCGPDTSLGRAKLRKPRLAEALCERRFNDIDGEWLFVVYYVTGFNEFLEERGAFMDPTGACSRAVEPRQSLNLIYEAIDFLLGKGSTVEQDARYEKMLGPFIKNWRMIPFVLMELNAWKREGRLDATSVASRGMCGDPKFKLFWSNAIDYAKRVPGTEE